MDNAWAIAITGGVVTVLVAVFGVIATCLLSISKSILKLNDTFLKVVSRDECADSMGEHCGRIGSLEERFNELQQDFAHLKGKAQVWHEKD